MQLLNFLMSPVTVWFWARMAAAEGADFSSTLGGSEYFFFARIRGGGITTISISISFLWFIYILIPTPLWMFGTGHNELSSYLRTIVWGPLFMLFWLSSMTYTVVRGLLMWASHPFVWAFTSILRRTHRPTAEDRKISVSRIANSGERKRNARLQRRHYVIGDD